ncbi:MAG: hypothetical protein R3E48_03650 [Burkholderiaceae bacterium]
MDDRINALAARETEAFERRRRFLEAVTRYGLTTALVAGASGTLMSAPRSRRPQRRKPSARSARSTR